MQPLFNKIFMRVVTMKNIIDKLRDEQNISDKELKELIKDKQIIGDNPFGGCIKLNLTVNEDNDEFVFENNVVPINDSIEFCEKFDSILYRIEGADHRFKKYGELDQVIDIALDILK